MYLSVCGFGQGMGIEVQVPLRFLDEQRAEIWGDFHRRVSQIANIKNRLRWDADSDYESEDFGDPNDETGICVYSELAEGPPLKIQRFFQLVPREIKAMKKLQHHQSLDSEFDNGNKHDC